MSLRPTISLIKSCYEVSKPGIVYGNLLTAAAGFFYAAHGAIDWWLFLAMMVGLTCVVASACAINNYYDRDIDAVMERTKNREIPAGRLSPKYALIFGIGIGIIGAKVLLLWTTLLAFQMAFIGWAVYLFLYTPLKRKTGYSLFVGAVSGAMPPVVGYTAVIPYLDSAPLIFFIFLFVWQIAHFIAIAIYRYDDYTAAGIPLFIKKRPSDGARTWARISFYISLVIILLFSLITSFA